ncbi:glycosyltransferase family 2 protein [Escherichia coli]|uniref:glycosyltransferase family 2 protein n=1 Tax=Escherichia coli TaxID=562 RepID=UPI0012FFE7E3|nr:glycosyltransferase family 2 protein [Escherichia coli]EJI6645810.1 glycosyltransferase family 2 protein [Escherichia coli]MCZ5425957.1 glycosyltransferase family 2 protein [Escherichia coli]HAH1129238.1 glycosyltransferase family 2 protein [Escherichia coli]HAH3676909.1 glycosyltransferase family 2 protein [Escherichia coli]HAO9428783.1 glycosyltransferase family 2 protein [Escherichia coli]
MCEISVIIPAYNAEYTISEALNSVCGQHGDFVKEIIVVDDGSSDNTSTIVIGFSEKYPSLIKLIKKNNEGVASARNEGVKYATGTFIAFLDADDVWYPDKLQKQMKFINEHDFSLVGGGFNGNYNGSDKDDGYIEISFKMQLLKQYFQPSTVLFKRDVLLKVPGFVAGRRYCEDALFFSQVCYHFRCAVLTSDLIKYGDDKHPYASGKGLGSHLWQMEKGELKNFYILLKDRKLEYKEYLFFSGYSLLKFCRRIIIKYFIYYPKNLLGL